MPSLRAQEIAGLTTAISANAFAERIPDFPWPEKTIQLDELLPGMKRADFSLVAGGDHFPGELAHSLA